MDTTIINYMGIQCYIWFLVTDIHFNGGLYMTIFIQKYPCHICRGELIWNSLTRLTTCDCGEFPLVMKIIDPSRWAL